MVSWCVTLDFGCQVRSSSLLHILRKYHKNTPNEIKIQIFTYICECKHSNTYTNNGWGSFLISLSGARVTEDSLWSFLVFTRLQSPTTTNGEKRAELKQILCVRLHMVKWFAWHFAVMKKSTKFVRIAVSISCTHVSHKSYKKQRSRCTSIFATIHSRRLERKKLQLFLLLVGRLRAVVAFNAHSFFFCVVVACGIK